MAMMLCGWVVSFRLLDMLDWMQTSMIVFFWDRSGGWDGQDVMNTFRG